VAASRRSPPAEGALRYQIRLATPNSSQPPEFARLVMDSDKVLTL